MQVGGVSGGILDGSLKDRTQAMAMIHTYTQDYGAGSLDALVAAVCGMIPPERVSSPTGPLAAAGGS